MAVSHMHRVLAAGVLVATLATALSSTRAAEPPAIVPPAAWTSSPYHGVIDGATGKAIPCLCRFGGSAYHLGETVCMNTHLGVQLARCDLVLNNTSWVPIGTPCTMSRLPRHFAQR